MPMNKPFRQDKHGPRRAISSMMIEKSLNNDNRRGLDGRASRIWRRHGSF